MKSILALVIFLAWAAAAQAQSYPATFNLAWQDNSDNEDSFVVFRDGVEVGKVGANVTTYSEVVSLVVDQIVCYEVTARNLAGDSPRSNKACASYKMFGPSPPDPAAVTINTPTGTTVSLSRRNQDKSSVVSVLVNKSQKVVINGFQK